MASTRTDTAGARLLGGRYRLRNRLGSGTSAAVYLADDTRLHRQVAVKVLHAELAEDEAFLERFRREARAAAALEHDNVVAVYDHGEDVDRSGRRVAWLVMPYLEGGSLADVLTGGRRLSLPQARLVGLSVARGLAAAHAAGLIHRDVKPANLLFGRDGRLRIGDFGLARREDADSLTMPAGLVVGTPRYCSPEQARHEPLDAKTDVYSLAVLLVEAVTGRAPFAADDVEEAVRARTAGDLAVPDELGALRDVLADGGRLDRAHRLDAATLARRLEALRDALGPADPIRLGPRRVPDDALVDLTDVGQPDRGGTGTPPVPRSRRPRRWGRRLAVLAAVVVVAAAAVAGALALTAEGPPPAYVVPDLAGRSQQEALDLIGGYGWRITTEDGRLDGSVPGQVIGQRPGPDVELREGEAFVLVISEGAEMGTVPPVAGLPRAEAEAALVAAEFTVGAVTEAPSEDVAPGVVMQQSVGDVAAEHGTAVDLVVSAGPPARAVPPLAGLTFEEAQAALAGLRLGIEREDVFDDTVEAGRVVSSEPAEAAQVARDSVVKVRVSKGPDLVTVPTVRGRTLAQAVARLQADGLAPGQVYGPALGSPISTNPAAGQKVRRGTVVDIYLG